MLNALTRLALGLLLTISTQAVAAAALQQQPSLVNAQFERGASGDAPLGWAFVTQSGASCQVVSEGATEGERAALVDGTESIRRGLSKLMQSVDAARLRGKKVRFGAAVRTAELGANDKVQLFG
ncbi:MAG: hypothetical protein VYD05_07985, partial [Planctomycetota bacterium]|nr:hypothetical protein [Planctomycetota bacterium]